MDSVLRVDAGAAPEFTGLMRFAVVLVLAAVLAGCAGDRSPDANDPWRALQTAPAAPGAKPPASRPRVTPRPPAAPVAKPPASRPIGTPSSSVTARVASVSLNGGFVVLNFPIGAVPGSGRRLNVYRGGLKVAENVQ